MSTFDDWFQPEAVENPTSEFLQTQYFMQKAFNAGMERAADIAKDMECEYSSVSWNNACLDVWREIRKEIISSMADVKLARQAFNAGMERAADICADLVQGDETDYDNGLQAGEREIRKAMK